MAWLSSSGTTQTHGDGLLAVGGTDKTVSVISMASATVVAQLKGHTNVRSRLVQSRGGHSVLTVAAPALRTWLTSWQPAQSAARQLDAATAASLAFGWACNSRA